MDLSPIGDRAARAWRCGLLLAVAVLAGGCASVTGGNTQKMYVQAQTQDGTSVAAANCTLSNDKGNWRVQSPGDATIVRSNKAMDVRCEKAPLPQGVVSVESGTRAAMFGNILIGGVIGAVVDHTSGAAYEYPERIRVVMGQMTSFTLPRGGASEGPPPTNFAALNDVAAVPHLNPRGRELYREWLGRPHPRAFAISPDGRMFGAYGTSTSDPTLPGDPVERATAGCERAAKAPCRLYAVNDNVVWVRDVPVTAAPSAPPAARPAALRAPTQPAPIASGYAAIEDVDAIPYLSDRGRAGYREWLLRPTPKAFAISTTGYWYPAWSLAPQDTSLPTDPTERAVVGCTRNAGTPCRLYAVNGSVVWVKPAP
ncbi:hypothetical protein HK414_23620 [Ramlibacter terrae]|uniref:DUF4189 domain-containing protein n=1 Tax=Ramlibacter terrae TaxID=2732511 RepID=A0ABX6P6F0_9BURK|nr:hypothetical protein HK414_23620 [Ramlibacter terrae]